MKKTNEKKVLVLSAVAIITLIAVVVGATYAYFQAQGGGSGNTNVNVQTATTDNLSFQIGGAISITANQEDFGQDMPNKSGSTTASATLTANNATNNATRNYYVYLDITSNNFEYTTVDDQAELLLKVTGPDGAEVTTLGSLERKTSGGVTGFDITSYDRLIAIADNYEITSTGTTTQDWTVEVIFVNLDSDQNANTGKTFNANLIIQEEEITTNYLSDYIINEVYAGVEGSSGIYYHDGIGEYTNAGQEAGDNSYRYSGSNDVVNNYVCFGPGAEADGTCANDNLYRIIGLFDDDNNGTYQAKLIKSTSYGNYAWDADNDNTWNATTKPDIYYTLNETYYSSLSLEWQNLIAEAKWQVGGFSSSDLGTTKETYNVEFGTGQSGYEETMKIGLMYVSDYGYGVSSEKWIQALSSYLSNFGTSNWLYIDEYQWLISRNISDSNSVFGVNYLLESGFVDNGIVRLLMATRPSFYLTSSAEISSGTGTSSDPFILLTN